MGIIRKQTIKSSVYQYLGILVGFITTVLVQPRALGDTSRVGLILILTSYSLLFSQFAVLGFHGTARYFPYFRNQEKKHHGYLFLFCLVATMGGILCTAGAFIFKDYIINEKAKDSSLFNEYFWYLIPLSFSVLFFNVFAVYTKMLFDATTSVILNEFVKRILILLTLILIYFNLVNFDTFMPLWLIACILPTIILILKVKNDKQLFLSPDFKFLNKPLVKNLVEISFVGILTGSAPLLVQNIDSYFITKNFSLGANGVYQTLFNFAIVISIPAKALLNISFSFVTEAWKINDMKTLNNLYKKSCINQIITALFIFIIIWANINNIFQLLPAEYAAAKDIFFVIAIGYIIDSLTGINSIILGNSRFYKVESFSYMFLAFVTIGLNMLLMPRFGVIGAAMSFALAMLIQNLFRYLFILIVFKMQPLTYKNLLAILVCAAAYYLSEFLPTQNSFILDTILRSISISLVFVPIVYFLKLSEDINGMIDEYLIKLKFRKAS